MTIWFGRPATYRRRTARPAALLVTVLAAAATAIWWAVLSAAPNGSAGSVCPPPHSASEQPLAATALDQVPPSAPNTVRIRVLNGGGQRGQASLVATQLGELGFAEAAEPSNDPLYPDGNLTCRGNIRFGPAGASAARTVGLVLPCLPLVRDTRTDDSVDVAIGTLFGEVNPARATREALEQLSAPPAQAEDGGAAPVDPDLLAKIRAVRC